MRKPTRALAEQVPQVWRSFSLEGVLAVGFLRLLDGQKGDKECFLAGACRDLMGAAVSVLDNLEFSIRENPSHEIEAGRKWRLGVLAGAGRERVGLSSKRPGQKARATPSEGKVRRQPRC